MMSYFMVLTTIYFATNRPSHVSKSGKMWLTTFTVMTRHLPVVLMTILVAFSSGVVILVQATGSCLWNIKV